jgi:hypothetical protein
MRRITVLIVSVAIASLGLIGMASPASASCTYVDGVGCVENVLCRLTAHIPDSACVM